MTQREEFEAWFHKYDDNNFMTEEDRELMFDAWQAAKAQAVPQWIPVSERLPYNKLSMWSDTVIAVSDIGDVFALSFMDGYWQRTSAFINSGSTEIIGWMPIPELPAPPGQNK